MAEAVVLQEALHEVEAASADEVVLEEGMVEDTVEDMVHHVEEDSVVDSEDVAVVTHLIENDTTLV